MLLKEKHYANKNEFPKSVRLEKEIEPHKPHLGNGTTQKTNYHLALFGKGKVGSTLIQQILTEKNSLSKKNIGLIIFSISDSKKVLLSKEGMKKNWAEELDNCALEVNPIETIIGFAKNNQLKNLIAIDNTASNGLVHSYSSLIKSNFHVVSSNKIANSIDFLFYKKLRKSLLHHNKKYLYETNVGAGLPIINTLNTLHHSGEKIKGIRGVFSGSMSYIFNRFSSENIPFSELLNDAIKEGFTEPDPREDLCGNDVARKLLILARELGLENEFNDISIENLIPENLRKLSKKDFLKQLNKFDSYFNEIKSNQKPNHVLRYVGELGGNIQNLNGLLHVKLISVPLDSPMGNLKNSDNIFEIHSSSYDKQPLVIQGAGAGAQVTARGVFGDVMKLVKI